MRTAAAAMRQVLVDGARARLSAKRGSGEMALPIEFAEAVFEMPDDELVRLNDALDELARSEPRLSQVVECRFFAGYSDLETAEVLDSSERTVRRDWQKARALLHEAMQSD